MYLSTVGKSFKADGKGMIIGVSQLWISHNESHESHLSFFHCWLEISSPMRMRLQLEREWRPIFSFPSLHQELIKTDSIIVGQGTAWHAG